MFSSSIQAFGDNKDQPDYVYYNADIINNTTANTFAGVAVIDPQIRFNETRDAPLIQNAADYYFSIVRFEMNGANRDLPLFIPSIQTGTGQTNVNLTAYSMAVPYQQSFIGSAGTINLSVQPTQRFIVYETVTQNLTSAPVPRGIQANQFVGFYDNTRQYSVGQIVSTTAANQYGSFEGPFFQVADQAAWNPQTTYPVGAIVSYGGLVYTAVAPNVAAVPSISVAWVLAPPLPGPAVLTGSPFWVQTTGDLGNSQDLTSRYYWVYTYQHWVDLWNKTMYDPAQNAAAPGAVSTCVYQDTYNALAAAFATSPTLGVAGYTFPYATFGDFVNVAFPPQMRYVPDTDKFVIMADSAAFGQRLTAFTPTVSALPVVGIPTIPSAQLFFNANMFGLFANYNNTYYNTAAYPDGYVNQILFTNKLFQNIQDFRLSPYAGVPPLGYDPINPDGSAQTPNMLGRVFILAEQDYSSTDSLWSPCSSIVFVSTLLPVKSEATGVPNVLGTGNLGNSQPTSQSAFQPIITDISLDTGGQGGAALYRKFIYYAPTAEYRLSDFSSSKQDIRNIDIQVYWKNRLDSQLYPINMFNLASVSVKLMFRRKDAGVGAPRTL